MFHGQLGHVSIIKRGEQDRWTIRCICGWNDWELELPKARETRDKHHREAKQ